MFLGKIKLENILSFKDAELELRPLNVLIGANASGKSNLIRALGLVKSLPRDMQKEISDGGGPAAWINRKTNGIARITLSQLEGFASYTMAFKVTVQTYEIVEEFAPGVFRRDFGKLNIPGNNPDADLAERTRVRETFNLHEYLENEAKLAALLLSSQQSVLTQVRIPGRPIAALAGLLDGIRLYREFKTGPGTQARLGINASALAEFLSEDGSNLALVLNELNLQSSLKRVNEVLHRFCDFLTDVVPATRGGITQLYVREEGVAEAFAAASLSDGTLRLLCLLAALLCPTPPPLVCIEEPEMGMHPDAIRMIADLLVEASSRTQLIVTTHSPALVDALSDQPESVVVCERDFDGFTEFRRLQSADLDAWLERYSLGELWQKGEIGGNRW
ncbi:MAG TPA: AAA family ATPase [Bryobacteraceae bacterium]|nr:AAA family ATPase [Bryobacteraceae bacterium]